MSGRPTATESSVDSDESRVGSSKVPAPGLGAADVSGTGLEGGTFFILSSTALKAMGDILVCR